MDGKLYRQVVETMVEGVAVQNAAAELEYVNGALCRLVGFSREELVGRPSIDFVAPSDQETFRRQQRLRQHGESQPYEMHLLSKHGEPILVQVSPQPLFDGDGRFVGSFAVVSDIRERRRTEVEREVISQIARGVVETANLQELLTLVHRALGRVVYAENCFVALLDDDSDMIQFPYFVDKYDKFQEPIPRGKTCTDYVLRTGRPLLLGFEVFEELRASGEVELVGSNSPSWMGVPLVTPQQTIGVLAVQHYEDEGAFSERDLEFFGSVGSHIALAIERKRAEEQLHTSRELYTNVVESMSNGVMVLDSRYHFLHWNRAMAAMSGTPSEKVLRNGRLPWEIFPHIKELGIDRLMQRAMEGEPQSAQGLEHHLPDGRVRVTNETYRPLRGPDRQILGVVGVVRDVTKRREAEEALRRSEEQLRQAQKMEAIGRLAGGIAHDFNNLLTAINGYSELIHDRLPTQDPMREHVGEIRKAGERAAEFTRQLLAFSRKQVIQPRIVNVNELVSDQRGLLQRLIGEHIELSTELADDLDCVRADPGQLEQLIINLVVNARDAMPTGGRLTIRTANRELDQSWASHPVAPGSYVGLEVEDTGVGMEPAILDRIFEPFFTTKEDGRGTGMGLSTVYGIVKQNGGYVWVDSQPGRGSVFWIYLPRTTRRPTSSRQISAADLDLQGTETVLVVEDEDSVRSLARMILEQQGYRVIDAGDPQEALGLCQNRRESIDLLISDVVMPRMSGPQLVAKLLRLMPDLRVLYISGHPDETILQHGVITEDTELLVKPFRVRELVARVRKVLEEPTGRH